MTLFVTSIIVAAGLVACSDDEQPAAADGKGALQVSTGECLLVDDAVGAEVSTLPVVDCVKPHTHEVFATVRDTEGDVYPGLATLEDFAERRCYDEFEGFVGISPFDSSLLITWIVPSLDGWNDSDDRAVLCILGRKDSGQLATSAKNLKI